MRFLADENFPAAAVQTLGDSGHDVVSASTVAPGSGDVDVMARVALEGRKLLTFDKDFGELARHAVLPTGCGVIFLRVPMPRPGEVGGRIAGLVTARDDWAGHVSVVDPGRVWMRPVT